MAGAQGRRTRAQGGAQGPAERLPRAPDLGDLGRGPLRRQTSVSSPALWGCSSERAGEGRGGAAVASAAAESPVCLHTQGSPWRYPARHLVGPQKTSSSPGTRGVHNTLLCLLKSSLGVGFLRSAKANREKPFPWRSPLLPIFPTGLSLASRFAGAGHSLPGCSPSRTRGWPWPRRGLRPPRAPARGRGGALRCQPAPRGGPTGLRTLRAPLAFAPRRRGRFPTFQRRRPGSG